MTEPTLSEQLAEVGIEWESPASAYDPSPLYLLPDQEDVLGYADDRDAKSLLSYIRHREQQAAEASLSQSQARIKALEAALGRAVNCFTCIAIIDRNFVAKDPAKHWRGVACELADLAEGGSRRARSALTDQLEKDSDHAV